MSLIQPKEIGSAVGLIQQKQIATIPVDTLLVVWGQSNPIDGSGNVTAWPYFTTAGTFPSTGGVWYWIGWKGGAPVYYSGAGVANAAGTTGNAFVTPDKIVTVDAAVNHWPMHLYLLRGLASAGIAQQGMLVAQDTTNLFADWDPAAVSGKLLYSLLLNEVDHAFASGGFTLNAKCRIWFVSFIGELDSTTLAWANAYQARWQAIHDGLKAHYPTHECLFTIVKTNPLTTGGTFVGTVNSAQDALVVANPTDTTKVEVADLVPRDNPHYGSNQLATLALRALHQYGTRTIQPTFSTAGGDLWSVGAVGSGGAATMSVVTYVRKTTQGDIAETHEVDRDGYNLVVGYNLQVIAAAGNAKLQLDIADGTAIHRTVTSSTVVLQQGKVHQASFTTDGATAKLYLDGVLVGSGAVVGYTAAGAFNRYHGRIPAGTVVELQVLAVSLVTGTALTAANLLSLAAAAKAADDYSISSVVTPTRARYSDWCGNVAAGWLDVVSQAQGMSAAAGTTVCMVEAEYP